MHKSVLDSMKSYLLVRWKKRWPSVVVTPVFIVIWAMTADPFKVHQQFQRAVILAVIFVVFGIVFPFRWGGEDWGEPRT